jgi:hypothetical protein
VEDEEVGRPGPALARHEGHELPLDLERVVALREASRFVTRRTCVSTAMPSFTSNAWPETTFAVLRPIPGSGTRAAMLRGTSPPWRSTRPVAKPVMLRAFAR